MRFFAKLVISFLFLQLFYTNSFSQNREYMLKAGFLEKFARFCNWPETVKMDTFKITVIGKSPFDGALEKMYINNKIKNKHVSLKYINSVNDLKDCHILFISSSESKRLDLILEKITSKSILTVGETNGFTKKGVIINFFKTRKGTVHFEISKKNIKNSSIEMDIMLLNFAKLVE